MAADGQLARVLKLARVEAGLGVAEAAKRVGVSRQSLSGWEREGGPDPTEENLERLSEVYGKPLEALRPGGSSAQLPAQPGVPRMSEGWHSFAPRETPRPQSARVFVYDFVAEAVRKGANEDDVSYIRRALEAPELAVVYAGGRPREATADELMAEMRTVAEVLRTWLDVRIARRREQGSGRTTRGPTE